MLSHPKRVLVVRLSSLGDVLLTIPVLQHVLIANSDIQLFVLTKQSYATIFQVLERTTVIAVNFREHKLFALYNKIVNEHQIELIIDLHQVLRTYLLGLFARVKGIPFFAICKHRWKRRRFLRHKNTITLPSVWEVYSVPFRKAGLLRDTNIIPLALGDKLPKESAGVTSFSNKKTRYIAIAPFAYYKEKIYPQAQMESLLSMLSKEEEYTFLLLGKGKKEEDLINKWVVMHERMISVCSMNLLEQLRLLSLCEAALVMDSANLHLSGLANVPKIIAVFGATSPYAGFNVWENTQILSTEIACRPCSIFGDKPCSQTSLKCMEAISPIAIFNALIN